MPFGRVPAGQATLQFFPSAAPSVKRFPLPSFTQIDPFHNLNNGSFSVTKVRLKIVALLLGKGALEVFPYDI